MNRPRFKISLAPAFASGAVLGLSPVGARNCRPCVARAGQTPRRNRRAAHRVARIRRALRCATVFADANARWRFIFAARTDRPALPAQLDASTNRWLFLTGEKTNLYPFIRQSFLLAVGEDNSSLGASFIHSSKIALADRHGVVRGYYDGLAALTPGWILNDIKKYVLNLNKTH